MPVNKKCSNCGAPVPDGTSVFCNRCGARLPATGSTDNLTCRRCGKTVTDRQSLFCDHCGSPLAPAAQDVTPAVPAVQAGTPAVPEEKWTICPTCGFKNPGENRLYCKKCGVYIPKKGPVQQYEPRGTAPVRRPQDGSLRIREDGMDAFRQNPVNPPVNVRQLPPGMRVLPRKRRKEAPERRGWISYRNVALGAAGIIILLLVIAFITGNLPGIPPAGSDNTTASAAPAPGLFDTVIKGILPNQTPGINQATPVVADTPLKTKGT